MSLADSITYTVTVGPAAGYLKDVPPAQWKDRDVAETVLIDRCPCYPCRPPCCIIRSGPLSSIERQGMGNLKGEFWNYQDNIRHHTMVAVAAAPALTMHDASFWTVISACEGLIAIEDRDHNSIR